ncbi:3-oxoacyl-[acyl-carrier-protein] synthase III C-terminal domain-containing protein [Actinomadura chokoriensis]|uniref:3-oxoacyl-[acyl-carrier-protein] synthase III C-terminal domain-containing protein n=1 Tax=Actinomadura chokoriensis TaxID=454156 RepID=A0ABV4QWY4_9ACTN
MDDARFRPGELRLARIQVAAGKPTPISDLPELEADAVAQLRAGGLRRVRVFDAPSWRFAADCLAATARGGLAGPAGVVYATEGGSGTGDAARDVARSLEAAGLGGLPLFGAGLNLCANLGAVLTVSGSLVLAGFAASCLAVTVDGASAGERLISGDMGIFSDAAASALVTRGPQDGPAFRILGIEHATSARLTLVSVIQQDPLSASAFIKGVEAASDRLAEATGADPDDYAFVIANSYVSPAVEAMLTVLGIPMSRAYRGTAREYAHCFAADGLVSLDRLERTGLLADGDKVLLLSTSTSTWFLIALEYEAGNAAAARLQ